MGLGPLQPILNKEGLSEGVQLFIHPEVQQEDSAAAET